MKRFRRLLVTIATALVGLMLVGGIAISVAREIGHGSYSKMSASKCSSPTQYVRRTALEIEDCIANATRRDMTKHGVVTALISVQRHANKAPLLKTYCHLAMHQLGREQRAASLAVAKLDGRLPGDANWNSSCVGGFLHGYLQQVAADSHSSEIVVLGKSWCGELDFQDGIGCAHAIGHGLSRAHGSSLKRSAADCMKLPGWLHRDCLSGAVMEVNFADSRLRSRMARDANLGPHAAVRCSDVAPQQRDWCRALFVKGEALTAALRTVA